MSPIINQELCELIRKAQGERSQNQFAQQCGISSAAITRISLGTYEPSAKTLKKIASRAHNGVTYEMLLSAAGLYNESVLSATSVTVPDKYSDVFVALNNGDKNLNQDDVDDIVKFIEFKKSLKK